MKTIQMCIRRWALAAALAAIHCAGGAQPAAQPRLVPAARVAHAASAAMLGGALAGSRAVAVGEHGVILLSDDGGKRWRQAAKVPVDCTLTAVSFVDARNGWAVGHWGVILATTDGGENWSVQRSAAHEDRPLFALHMLDAGRGVAVGLWSLVLVTADGGKSWEPVAPPRPEGASKADLNLLGLFANERGELFATAERGMLLRSPDGGRSWSYLSTGYKGSFWTGAALPGGVLLAAGLRGTVYRSADDGRSWTRVETGSKASVTALAARGADLLGVGLDGLVLRSRDGGASLQVSVRADHRALTGALLLPAGRPLLLSRQGPVADLGVADK